MLRQNENLPEETDDEPNKVIPLELKIDDEINNLLLSEFNPKAVMESFNHSLLLQSEIDKTRLDKINHIAHLESELFHSQQFQLGQIGVRHLLQRGITSFLNEKKPEVNEQKQEGVLRRVEAINKQTQKIHERENVRVAQVAEQTVEIQSLLEEKSLNSLMSHFPEDQVDLTKIDSVLAKLNQDNPEEIKKWQKIINKKYYLFQFDCGIKKLELCMSHTKKSIEIYEENIANVTQQFKTILEEKNYYHNEMANQIVMLFTLELKEKTAYLQTLERELEKHKLQKTCKDLQEEIENLENKIKIVKINLEQKEASTQSNIEQAMEFDNWENLEIQVSVRQQSLLGIQQFEKDTHAELIVLNEQLELAKTELAKAHENLAIQTAKVEESATETRLFRANLVELLHTMAAQNADFTSNRYVYFPKPPLSQSTIQTYLSCIANGDEREARNMLIQDKRLAFAKGTIQDRSGRVFENMTGLQYAVWALDWQMWNMILQYLPTRLAAAQLKSLNEEGTKHGCYFNWMPVVKALQANDGKIPRLWHIITTEQQSLPANLVQEYCLKDRGFNEETTFTEPHNRGLEVYVCIEEKILKLPIPKDENNFVLDKWYAAPKEGQYVYGWTRRFGPIVRGAEESILNSPTSDEAHALLNLCNTRFAQRNELGKKFGIDMVHVTQGQINLFFQAVTNGDSRTVEKLLKRHPQLAEERSDIIDRAGRKFANMTGFQYAIWALDWQTWGAILEVLSVDKALSQLHEWEAQCLQSYLIDALITAYDNYINQANLSSFEQIGAEQQKLPVHVIRHYYFKEEAEEKNIEEKINEWFKTPTAKVRSHAKNANLDVSKSVIWWENLSTDHQELQTFMQLRQQQLLQMKQNLLANQPSAPLALNECKEMDMTAPTLVTLTITKNQLTLLCSTRQDTSVALQGILLNLNPLMKVQCVNENQPLVEIGQYWEKPNLIEILLTFDDAQKINNFYPNAIKNPSNVAGQIFATYSVKAYQLPLIVHTVDAEAPVVNGTASTDGLFGTNHIPEKTREEIKPKSSFLQKLQSNFKRHGLGR